MFDLYNSSITQKDWRAVNDWGLAISSRMLSLRSEVMSEYGVDLDASEATLSSRPSNIEYYRKLHVLSFTQRLQVRSCTSHRLGRYGDHLTVPTLSG